jgi:hypothetical protein
VAAVAMAMAIVAVAVAVAGRKPRPLWKRGLRVASLEA